MSSAEGRLASSVMTWPILKKKSKYVTSFLGLAQNLAQPNVRQHPGKQQALNAMEMRFASGRLTSSVMTLPILGKHSASFIFNELARPDAERHATMACHMPFQGIAMRPIH